MNAASLARPMIRNTAGTTMAMPHTAIPPAISSALGRPFGMNRWISGVPRASQASASPATSSSTPTARLRARAMRSESLVRETAMTCMPASWRRGSPRPMGESGYAGPLTVPRTGQDPSTPQRPRCPHAPEPAKFGGRAPNAPDGVTRRSLPAEDPRTIATRPHGHGCSDAYPRPVSGVAGGSRPRGSPGSALSTILANARPDRGRGAGGRVDAGAARRGARGGGPRASDGALRRRLLAGLGHPEHGHHVPRHVLAQWRPRARVRARVRRGRDQGDAGRRRQQLEARGRVPGDRQAALRHLDAALRRPAGRSLGIRDDVALDLRLGAEPDAKAHPEAHAQADAKAHPEAHAQADPE